MAGFTSDVTMQIDEYHRAQGAVSVERVERCDGKCRLIYAQKSLAKNGLRRMEMGSVEQEGSFRRMETEMGSLEEMGSSRRLQDDEEGNFLYVTLGFRSTANPAGRILNVFQNHVVDTRN